MTAGATTTTTVARLVANILGLPRLPEPHQLLDDLGADSLGRVEISMAAEEEFGIDLTDADLEDIRTVADLAALCERKQGVAA